MVHATTPDRETCKTHEYFTILANNLKQNNILHANNVAVLADGIVCEPSNKACMYDECAVCKHKVPGVNGYLQDEVVTYTQ